MLNKSKGNMLHGNRWNGGRSLTPHGYVLIRQPEHPRASANGCVYEHILVAEKKLGRPLEPNELVHHIDGNGQNNNPSNIKVVTSVAEHKLQHRLNFDRRLPNEPNPIVYCACGCGSAFPKYDNTGRPRKYLRGGHWRKGKKGGWNNAT